jgi:hypothetical protein
MHDMTLSVPERVDATRAFAATRKCAMSADWSRREFLRSVSGGVALSWTASLWAQSGGSNGRYNEVKIAAVATGEELAAQPDLWVMEVYFRPLRQVVVTVTDPVTKEAKPTYVWYLPYRAFNRPLATRNVGVLPENELDQPVLPAKFIPEFELITTDTTPPRSHVDRVIPEALPVIARRERLPLLNSVTVVSDLPAALPADDPAAKAVYGVAMWQGIDTSSDRYTVFMTGFSNGMKPVVDKEAGDAAGLKSPLRVKTIEMSYWRPGDQYDLREPEIRLDSVPRWIYR